MEAVFHETASNPNEVARFLRTLSLYVAGKGDVFEDGHTTDGPGGARWRAMRSDEAVADPPRSTVRFFPASGPEPPNQPTLKKAHEP